MATRKINDLRKEIDKIDSNIVRLIDQRGRITSSIGEIKNKRAQPVYRPDRESQVYSRVIRESKGPIKKECIKAVYREIMSGCLSLERPIKVAYLGPELTFTHQAALKKFGVSLDYTPCDSISGVFDEVEKEKADYGVVPIENSTEGAVNHTLDMFVDSPLIICSEVYLDIRQDLLASSRDPGKIKKIYSHPNVFGQCRLWLEKNLPAAKPEEVASTAKAAEEAAKRPFSACIASALAAEKYGLKIVSKSIQDSSVNITRFLVISRYPSGVSGNDKTSIFFSVQDTPGVLHQMLGEFRSRNINLTKIESRPSKKGLWKYYFFIDMEGHITTPKVKAALKEIEKKACFVKMLGSYPSAL
jgi:chorismate mutase / prephenate dehydratase